MTRIITNNTVAVFDFDGTITFTDTLFPFLLYYLGLVRFIIRFIKSLPILVAYVLKIMPNNTAKQKVLECFIYGECEEDIKSYAHEFSKSWLQRLIKKNALNRLFWHKQKGHYCILISASLDIYIKPWAQKIGFDNVICSSLEVDEKGFVTGRLIGQNCHGAEKLLCLHKVLGSRDKYIIYAYGDSKGDKELLSDANFAYYRSMPVEKLTRLSIKNYLHEVIKLMRTKQWVKNSFVFAGLIFNHDWNNMLIVKQVIITAIAFCLLSSSIYIINDIADKKNDQQHPKKRNRPIASEKVSIKDAIILAILLGSISLTMSKLWVTNISLYLLLIYATTNLAYSFCLKHVVILDVFIIAAGFMLRILAGTIGVGIKPSNWLLLTSIMITLFLGFTKRRAEIISLANQTTEQRNVLDHYNVQILDIMIGISSASAMMSYSLFTMSPNTIGLHGTDKLIYTTPFVLYGMFRYLYLLYIQKQGEDPTLTVINDAHIVVTMLLWLGLTIWLIA